MNKMMRLLCLLVSCAISFSPGTVSAQTAAVPPGYLQALEQAAGTIQQDQANQALQASLGMPVRNDNRWQNSTVSNVVAQYWSAYPGAKTQLIALAKDRFPWYEPADSSAFNQVAQAPSAGGGPILYPSSQYVQPRLADYGDPLPSSAVGTAASSQAAEAPVAYPVLISDPFEGFNRGVFYFNAKFDQYLFVPVTDAYKFITPDFVETGVHNFFENITEITSFGNEILQLDLIDAGKTALRFGINTTIGIAGLIDVADKMGLPQDKEDFGQTLGHWGVGDGPYIVLPILGPSNLRDTTGLVVDAVAFNYVDPFGIASFREDYPAIYVVQAVDTRASIDYRYHASGSPFEYDLVRYLISKKRQIDIAR